MVVLAFLKKGYQLFYELCVQVGLFTASFFFFIIHFIGAALRTLVGGVRAFFRAPDGKPVHIVVRIFNYAAPLAAAGVLLFAVLSFVNINFALEVTIDGRHLAYISHERVFEEAYNGYKSRITMESEGSMDIRPEYHIQIVGQSALCDSGTLCERLITNDSTHTDGVGFYSGDVLLLVTDDETALYNELENILADHKTKSPNERVSFIDNVRVIPGLYPSDAIKSGEQIAPLLRTVNMQKTTYKAVKGDSFDTVATKLGVSAELLKGQNAKLKKLRAGDVLSLETELPLLSIKIVRDRTEEKELPFQTITKQESQYTEDYKQVTIKGNKGKASLTVEDTYINGRLTASNVINTEVIQAPVDETVTVGTKKIVVAAAPPPAPVVAAVDGDGISVGSFVWPIAKVTQGRTYVSSYWGDNRGHRGIDIAAPLGTNIYAADGGTVVSVSNARSGYGLHFVIDHGNGIQTLYAHCSSVAVKVGQKVTRGQVVGAVGSTGRSTGNHLHFEVLLKGSQVDPAPYVGLK